MAKILAIDDSDQNLILIQLYLKEPEFEVVTARGGHEGLLAVAADSFDLLLVDVVMPGLDGFEVCRRIKADPRTAGVPVIFLSGRQRDAADKLHGYEIGAADYITKPVDKQELLARIRVMLRLREARAKLEQENRELASSLQRSERELERVQGELADLRALRAEHEAAAPSAVLLLDRAGKITSCDERLHTLLGPCEIGGHLGGDSRGRQDRLADLLEGLPPNEEALLRLAEDIWLSVVRRELPGREETLVELRDVSRRVLIESRLEDRREQIVAMGGNDRGDRPRCPISGFVGESAELDELMGMVRQLRNGRSTVLICGESGTGKELVARALHFEGSFADRPFIPFHCGAISPELIESELFGYEKGSFTGALGSKPGLFAAADGGTIFLDEIAEASFDLQVKLLRVLQLGEIRPVGATRSRHVDVRILAATNKDLLSMVRAGSFREDLYYRLEVVGLRVPSLRERSDDIPVLVDWFCARFNELYDRKHQRVHGVSRKVMGLLTAYSWPGNVRELENTIDRAFALGCGEVIGEEDLPLSIRTGRPSLEAPSAVKRLDSAPFEQERRGVSEEIVSLRAVRSDSERQAIQQALSRFGGDKSAAARSLRMSRSTLYRRLRELGM